MSNPPSVRNLIGNMSTSSSDGNGIWVSVDHSIPNSASKEPPSSPRLIVVFDNIDSRYHDQVFNYDRRAGKKRKKKKKKTVAVHFSPRNLRNILYQGSALLKY